MVKEKLNPADVTDCAPSEVGELFEHAAPAECKAATALATDKANP